MLLTGQKVHGMGKDSEAGEKLSKGGRGIVQQGGTDSTGPEMKRQTRAELVPGTGKGAECQKECREAGGDADTIFCPFSSKETRSSAVKKKEKKGWRNQRCAWSSHRLNTQ